MGPGWVNLDDLFEEAATEDFPGEKSIDLRNYSSKEQGAILRFAFHKINERSEKCHPIVKGKERGNN